MYGPVKEHLFGKVIPDDDTLEDAYRRAYGIASMNELVKKEAEAVKKRADRVRIPKQLRDDIQSRLEENPALPWDKALADVVRNKVVRSGKRKSK